MQGVVTDEKGAYVKAAIIKLYKVQDSDDESESEVVTYAEADEEGRFVIQDLDPEEIYFIEIHVERQELKKENEETKEDPEPVAKMEEPEKKEEPEKIEELESDYDTAMEGDYSEIDEEMNGFEGGNGIIDSLKTNNMIDDTIRGSISICNLNYMSGLNLKDKPYLMKSNLW